MEIHLSRRDPVAADRDALVALVPASEGLPRFLRGLDAALGGTIRGYFETGDFTGKAQETIQLPAQGVAARRVHLIGLGEAKEVDGEVMRRAAGGAVTAAMRRKGRSLALLVPPVRRLPPAALGQALTEGALLGTYRFDGYRTLEEPTPPVDDLELIVSDSRAAGARQGVRVGRIVAEATNFARDLSNEPGSVHTPVWLADQTRRMARGTGLRVRILDEAELEKHKMGGLLAVGRGAKNPPRLIVVEHNAPARGSKGRGPKRATVALVGKGITFDTGGVSIKPAASMEEMKHDMSGGAAVLGAMRAVAELKLPLHVVGIVAAAQNMPGQDAYLPGDVVRTASGKTIEILNTDAEGRIVLSDALHHATSFEPAAIIDLATLTGAKVIALGEHCCAVMGNDDKLIGRIREAGDRSHERAWPLPLWREHKEQIKSRVADMKNTAGRNASSITAAALLSHFVGDFPWAHLDIAGNESVKSDQAYCVQGATGFGVRLLVELLRGWR
jgi:leucyl aminopeptidase